MLRNYQYFNHLIKNQSFIVRLQFVRVVLRASWRRSLPLKSKSFMQYAGWPGYFIGMQNFGEMSVSQFERFAEKHSNSYGYRRIVQNGR